MELRFKGCDIIATAYVVPTISHRGRFTCWKGQHATWKHGFVIRLLWFGFVARWGYVKRKSYPVLYEEAH